MGDYENHIYGCEMEGCERVGMKLQEWLPGYGYQTVYYCSEHLPSLSGPPVEEQP